MITLKSSKEEVVLKNNPYVKEETKSDEVYESDEETVLIEDAKGNARPYVLKEINPQIEGIVVVISSRLDNMEQEVNDVVLALFDIPVHKIKVMNMK
jgi:stage III sporulation protein AG